MIEKDFGLNEAQAIALLVNAKKNWIVWGRGTGKTTGVIGPKSLELVHLMPGAKGMFIGKDYEQIRDRTLPPAMSAWSDMGYKMDKKWKQGRPKPSWKLPIITPLQWDNYISWYNGSAIQLTSLTVKAAANGASFQWAVGDEAKFFDEAKLNEALKAVRGLESRFGHLPEYGSYWFATDKWTQDIADIQWILKKREKMNPEAVKIVYSLQLEINRLREGYDLLLADGKKVVDQQIKTIETIINPIRKKMVYFSEASARDNIMVLGDEYIESQKEDLEADEFDVAIDNEDPKNTRTGFYPTLAEIHEYSSGSDVNPSKPLIIAPDYQAAISPILTAQYDLLPWERAATLNMTKQVFTKQPQSLTDAIALWSTTFKFMIDRTVYYVYDHTAVGRNPQQLPYYKLVIKELRKNGWSVVEINLGKAPDHDVKYEIIKDLYDVDKPSAMPEIRWNKLGCKDAHEAMKLAKTRVVNGLTKKDKRHEDTNKYPKFPQEHATHFTDCHDMIVWATHHLKMIPLAQGSSSFASSIGNRK